MNRFKFNVFCIFALLVGITAILSLSGTANADTDNSNISEADLDQRTRVYILNHPDAIVEAIQKWQTLQQQGQAQQPKEVLKARRDEIFNDPAAPVSGNPAGDVTIVEFMDYNCGYCRKTFPEISRLLEEDSKIRLVLKEFPVLGTGSEFAARAALASQQQGRYTEFHNAMMQSKQNLEEQQVLAIAQDIGLNIEQLKKDMSDPEIQNTLVRNYQLAQALAINGTPSFVVGDDIVRGAVDLTTLERLVEKTGQAQ